MDSDDSNYIDSDTEAYLYSQVYHDHQTTNPMCNDERNSVKGITVCPSQASKSSNVEISVASILARNISSEHLPVFCTGSSVVTENERTFEATSDSSVLQRSMLQPSTSGNGNECRSERNLSTQKMVSKSCSTPVPTRRLESRITVICEEDLVAEKPNIRKPIKRLSSLSTEARNCSSPKRIKTIVLSDNSSESSDCAVIACSDIVGQKVVINVDSSTESNGFEEIRRENDPTLWHISSDDRFKFKSPNRQMYVMCYNCRERGHLSRSCPRPKKLQSCYLCGEPGHKGESCANPVCSRCLLPGHWHYQCHWSPNSAPPCALCDGRGHLCQECPSIWRRYHLTTTAGPLKTVSNYVCKERTTPYCYLCGRQGHYGYVCKVKKRNNIFPVNRVITDYGDPRSVIFNKANTKRWRRKLQLCNKSGTVLHGPQGKVPQPNKQGKVSRQNKQRKVSQQNKQGNVSQQNKQGKVSQQNKNWKAMQKELQLKNRVKNKKKKKQLQSNRGGAGLVRVNPVTETNFPRTSKKGSNVQKLQATAALKEKALKIRHKRSDFRY